MNKELNKGESIAMNSLKKSPYYTLADPKSKTLAQTVKDYNAFKAKYNVQDQNLKKKLGEIVNRKKND